MKPKDILKMKGAWERFVQAHPRIPAFMQAASQGMVEEGSIIDLTIIAPDGRKIATNVKLTAEDMETIRSFK